MRPEHTSSYVGFGEYPPAYPTAVVYTPDASQNFRSAPQKHPIPTTIISSPSGKGGRSGAPSTSCAAGTGISRSRPGNACSAATISAFLLKNPMPYLRFRALTLGRVADVSVSGRGRAFQSRRG